MSEKLKIRGVSNPFGRDLLPLDIDVDIPWLRQAMAATGKTASECIADELTAGFHRSLRETARINREYAAMDSKELDKQLKGIYK